MQISVVQKITSAIVVTLGVLSTGMSAQAGNLVNGWNYARDDYSYDGYGGGDLSATSQYDIYGIGIKEVGNEIWVGISASNPLTGVAYSGATDGNIGWGDLLLDFNYGKPNNSFASAQGSLIGVRFAATNDSGALTTGVYTGVTAKSVTQENSGFSSLSQYTSYVPNARIGDLALNDPYYAAYASARVPNSIGSYSTRVGDVTALLASDLTDLPDPTLASNNLVKFGFKFERPVGFSGEYLGSLFLECFNDSVAIRGNSTRSVPVPPAIAGIFVAGALGVWQFSKRKQLKVKFVA
jgi:hypothetical protein